MRRAADVVVWLAGVAAATAVILLFTLEGRTEVRPGEGADGSTRGASPSTPVAGPEEILAFGRVVYAEHCAQCHGTEGQGGTGAALAGSLVATFPDPDGQTAVILAGRGVMPAFADLLTTEEIDAVVAFTRAEFG